MATSIEIKVDGSLYLQRLKEDFPTIKVTSKFTKNKTTRLKVIYG